MEIHVLFWSTVIAAFVLGAIIGSFLNVVIYRVPAGLSVAYPPSRCPSCESRIAWYDNIPMLSWLILRGRCRNCDLPISPRYALVELLTGLLTAAVWAKSAWIMVAAGFLPMGAEWTPIVLPAVFHAFFVWLLIVIAFVDLDHFIIPHRFTIPGMIAGLAYPWVLAMAIGPLVTRIWPPVTPMGSFIGFVAGGLAVVLIFYAYLAVRGIEGIGGGDVTLMAMIGAWLGWQSLVYIFFAASLQGLIAAGLAVFFGFGLVKDSAEIFADDAPAPGKADGQGAPMDATTIGHAETSDAVEAGKIGENGENGEIIGSEEDHVVGGMPAVPYGPFLSLAALEYLLLAPLLPPEWFSYYYL